MALTVSFSASSVSGSPSNILFSDLSTGTDAAVVSRRIYVSDSNGDYIVVSGITTEYNEWTIPLSGVLENITLDLLLKDMAVKITVQWLNVSNVVLYDYTINAVGFIEYNEEFDYGLTTLMAVNPLLINDNNFWGNKTKLRTLIDSGNNAITRASDLYNAQQCYDEATDLRLSSQYFFNGNS